MDERTEIAAMAMEGILIGSYSERPNAKPKPERVAQDALAYSDVLRATIKNTPDPTPWPERLGTEPGEPCLTPKV